jgi:hypothetical protein
MKLKDASKSCLAFNDLFKKDITTKKYIEWIRKYKSFQVGLSRKISGKIHASKLNETITFQLTEIELIITLFFSLMIFPIIGCVEM